jgi:hypothetical protein
MIPFFKSKLPASVLGLSLDGNRLEGVVIRRLNGSLEVKQSFSANLALSPLTGDPELVGREIRNHLDEAGIRERRCALCLPLNWVLSLQTSIPDLPEADRASFLQLEAERGFHSDDLIVSNSIFKTAQGPQFATLLSVSRSNVAAIEKALAAAKLKIVTLGVGVAAMQPGSEETSRRVVSLAVGVNSVGLQVTAGGGIVALRSLDNAIETDGAQKHLSADLVARELRITLGQLPGDPGEGGILKVFGQTEMARQLVSELSPRLYPLGLTLEIAQKASDANFEGGVPPEFVLSPALALAAASVRGVKTVPEFLPPKVNPWQQFAAARLSPRKLAYAGGVVGFVVFCIVAAFGWQQWELHHLRAQLSAVASQIDDIKGAQDQIVKYRAFYDNRTRPLQILTKLTDAFPEDGAVTAKTVEIRDLTAVNCAGTARDNASFLAMHAKLRALDGVTGLHAEIPHAQPPLQFSLNFQVEGAVTNGN